jgi:hypothetical protein
MATKAEIAAGKLAFAKAVAANSPQTIEDLVAAILDAAQEVREAGTVMGVIRMAQKAKPEAWDFAPGAHPTGSSSRTRKRRR